MRFKNYVWVSQRTKWGIKIMKELDWGIKTVNLYYMPLSRQITFLLKVLGLKVSWVSWLQLDNIYFMFKIFVCYRQLVISFLGEWEGGEEGGLRVVLKVQPSLFYVSRVGRLRFIPWVHLFGTVLLLLSKIKESEKQIVLYRNKINVPCNCKIKKFLEINKLTFSSLTLDWSGLFNVTGECQESINSNN